MSDEKLTEEERKQGISVHSIKIDTQRTEALARENERLKISQEQQKNEPSLETLKIQAIQKFGRPDLFLDCDSKESLSGRITNYINEIASRGKGESAGSPLVPQQFGQTKDDLYTRKFYDSQQMVSELRRLSREGNSEEKQTADHYISEIWKKYILEKRSNPTRSEPSQNLNSPEALSELDLVQRDGFLTPRNKEDSEIGQLQKRWREMRKRRSEGQSE